MYLLRKLAWFFKLEKRRYLTGIIALGLVSVFNLIPPRVMGEVIDKIDSQVLTTPELFINVLYLVLSGLAMYGLRYVWRMYIFGRPIIWDKSCAIGSLSILPACRLLFFNDFERGI